MNEGNPFYLLNIFQQEDFSDADFTRWILPSSYPELNSNEFSYPYNFTEDSEFFNFYYPINIFLNEFDGRCTADCRAEGRHYVNPDLLGTGEPFDYNPWKVVAY